MMRAPDRSIPVIHKAGEPFHGEVVFGPEDIPYGFYMAAMPGSGKSSMLVLFWEGFNEWAKVTGKDVAIITIDPKGDVADWYLERTPELNPDKLWYIDPSPTGTRISFNFMKLPPYKSPDDRDRVVLTTKGFVLDMLTALVGYISEQTPQLRRILRTDMEALYVDSDSPSPVKLHSLLLGQQSKDPRVMRWLESKLGDTKYAPLLQDITSLSGLEASQYHSVLNRIGEIASNNFLATTLSAKDETIDWQKMLESGHRTIFRLTKTGLGDYLPLVMGAIVMKILFAVMERANNVPESERVPVLLILDEFQIIQAVSAIQDSLALFRQYGLGLGLAHQGTEQLNDKLFRTIMSTVHTQIVGKVSGDDAKKFAEDWEVNRTLRDQLAEKLKNQKQFEWAFRIRQQAGAGPLDYYFRRTRPVRSPLHTKEECEAFKQLMRQKFGNGAPDTPLFEQETVKAEWRRLLPVGIPVPDQKEWEAMLLLKKYGELTWTNLTKKLRLNRDRDSTLSFVDQMEKAGYIKSRVAVDYRYYSLGDVGSRLLSPDLASMGICKTPDGLAKAQKALEYHQSRYHFVYPAEQQGEHGLQEAPDLIVYDYTTRKAISVEVESRGEVESRFDQVGKNMEKAEKLGFASVETWVDSDQRAVVEDQIKDYPPELKARIVVMPA